MAEYAAASLSPASVQAAINQCTDGDTLVLPAGDYSGFTGVTLNHHVSIRGQGKNNTVIRKTNLNENPPIIQFYLPDVGSSPPTVEINDFSICGATNANDTGLIFRNPWFAAPFLVHDMSLRTCGQSGITFNGRCTGVVWNSDFLDCYYQGSGYGVEVLGNYPGDALHGDWAWNIWPATTNPGWGGSQFVFVEDCYFDGCRHSIASAFGARWVFRYNTSNSTPYGSGQQHVDAHGKGSGTSYRAVRAVEIYNNIIRNYGKDYDSDGIYIHGGDCLVHDNTLGPRVSGNPIQLDGDNLVSYPDPDQPRASYFWNNVSTEFGNLDNYVYYPDASNHGVNVFSYPYIQHGRDFHIGAFPGYVPYAYPHPLRGGAVGDFSIISMDSGLVKAGQDIGFTVYAQPGGGFIGPVTFSALGGPPGTVRTWPRGTVWNAGGENPYPNLILNLAIPLNAPLRDYPITVTGISP